MKNQKGSTTLVVILVVAAAALLFGFLVIRQRIKKPSPVAQSNSDLIANPPSDQTTPAQTPDQTSQAPDITPIPADWKVYNNAKYGFSLQYPPGVKAGTISGNSALGTAAAPIKGFHVGTLVLVALKDASIQKQASDYFNQSYNLALHPQPAADPGIQGPACTADKINNPNATVSSVSCTGEGGPERYAYIKGTSYDIFVDGYSQGYDKQDNGKLADGDYEKILSSFSFAPITTTSSTSTNSTASVTGSTPTPAPSPTPNPTPAPAPSPTPAPNPSPTPTPSIKTFTISADDSNATPSVISVAAGTIVEITFNVSATNVYYGGLDFRSSVVNSGTVLAGQSKTISFTANQSFQFTPYWPASNVAKPYTISVTVQ
ncbi:MAG: hypothetical protein WDN47_02410 [Candidatus Doudnabacteria bacterium]